MGEVPREKARDFIEAKLNSLWEDAKDFNERNKDSKINVVTRYRDMIGADLLLTLAIVELKEAIENQGLPIR